MLEFPTPYYGEIVANIDKSMTVNIQNEIFENIDNSMTENTQNQIDKNIEKGKSVMEMSKQVGDENCYFDQIDLDVLIDNFTEGGPFDENENSDKDDDFGVINPSNDSGMSIDDNSEDDFDSDKSSDRENETNIVFKQGDLLNPWFEIGQTFGSKKLFREAVHGHAIRTRRSLKITKNDKRRIYARCVDEKCDWHINALKIFNQESFQIREYNSNHKCGRQYHVNNVSSKWLANKFVEAFRIDPSRNVKGFRNEAIRDIRCHVSPFQAYRAKQKALKSIEGSDAEQYSKLWDYAEALRENNPGSTVLMCLTDSPEGQKRFEKLYVCLNALKIGFLAGCRPIIGVDGCHLKGPHGGVLLTAVSIDPNNNPYPIAYAVVCSETKESWVWFLRLLREDLQIERDELWTFISDKQKGLIPAFESVFPGASNRFCVRHLHGNMKTAGFRGTAFKQALWAVAKATTIAEFNVAMQKVGDLDARCLEWLSDKPATQWSKAHFSTYPKCDILLNNICEVFNSCILDARQKAILTMLEWIREYLMTRLQQNRDRAKRLWKGRKLCPKIMEIVKKNGDKAIDCIPIKSNDWKFEIDCSDGSRHTVDLHAHTCSCRLWDLTGIPCKHGVSAIEALSEDPEDYVLECYSVENYCKVYETPINPMSGPMLWEKTGYIPPLPPNFGRKRGRPSRARRLGADEIGEKGNKRNNNALKLGKQKYSVTCRWCGQKGHNQRACKWKKLAEEGLDEELTQPVDFPHPTHDEDNANEMEKVVNTPNDVVGQKRKMTARKKATCASSTFKLSKTDGKKKE